jgi:hypothetical protein
MLDKKRGVEKLLHFRQISSPFFPFGESGEELSLLFL